MNRRLNAICPYFAMFPLDFPDRVIRESGARVVLDPFCGRGTTNLAARLNGVRSVGIDSSKVAYAIASSKMVSVTPDAIVSECEEILTGPVPEDVPEGEFWSMMYDRRVLEDVCRLREAFLGDCSTPERQALRGIVLGALHGPLRVDGGSSYLSNQFPRTYASKPDYSLRFWRSRGYLVPPEVSVRDTVAVRADRYFSDTTEDPRGFIVEGDSTLRETFEDLNRRMDGRSFDSVITSPPYLGMYTYIPDQWLRHWFVGGPPDVEYSLKGQVHDGVVGFMEQLRSVWVNCADVCDGGATLTIRFGRIGSKDHDPWDLMTGSLEGTDWNVIDSSDAGTPGRGRRQSDAFLGENGNGYREIDVRAVLG